jgi:hypothetical protein
VLPVLKNDSAFAYPHGRSSSLAESSKIPRAS